MASFKKISEFTSLNLTQFLGALNDNLYKLFLIFYLIDLLGKESSNKILSIAGGVFVVPFLLFSAFGGTLADRYSKRSIIILTKCLEVVGIIGGLLSFYFALPWLGYTALFLMGAQSALFGPSKYGIIPEIVAEKKISAANGIIASFTYFAVILGTFLAALLTQLTDHRILLAATSCVLIAFIGLATSLCLPKTGAAGSNTSFSLNFLKEIINTLRRCAHQQRLFLVIICGAFFLFIGGFVQLNIIPYGIDVLGLSDVGGGYLFLATALGIGLGALIAGRLSGKKVQLGLVPIGLFGIFLFLLLLGLGIVSLTLTVVSLILLGLSGGLYLVPLDSYIQAVSNDSQRGQNVAANNFMGFIGVLIASTYLYLFGHLMGLSASHSFLVIAILSGIFLLIVLKAIGEYLISFVVERYIRTRYKILPDSGKEWLEKTGRVFFAVNEEKSFSKTLLIGLFPKPVRLIFLRKPRTFIEKHVLSWIGYHYLYHDPEALEKLERELKKRQRPHRVYCILGPLENAKKLAAELNQQEAIAVELDISPKMGRPLICVSFVPL